MPGFRCLPIDPAIAESFRATGRDQAGNTLRRMYDLGHAGDGQGIDAPLAAALADPRTAFVNVHTAKPGCLLCRVERG